MTNLKSLPGIALVEGGTSSDCAGWTLHEVALVTSTNLLAATLPAWSAVRANVQTKGRGRFQRAWVSDEGGLWLSAVVPAKADSIFRCALPLVTGLAICQVLKLLGIPEFRLRWPNDILVNDRKLAGLLIDQFASELAVIGIGMNVSNNPEASEPRLKNQTIRLADLLLTAPDLPDLTALVLQQLRATLNDLEQNGATHLFESVNKLWDCPRNVELDLDGTLQTGNFQGVDHQGRLILANTLGNRTFYEAHQVRHLAEL
jgi:BirA family biotin operon repressor/biotin-[acetyl-CoA-carboxylase] ligase